ncbi:MAG: AMP-binding protein, partial [Rhodocyclaceae bacterium]
MAAVIRKSRKNTDPRRLPSSLPPGYSGHEGEDMASTAIIRKTSADWRVSPNFSDYEGQRQRFDWQAAQPLLAGPAGFNIGWATTDRWLATGRAAKVAFRFLAADQPTKEMTYAELAGLTNRFAHVLQQLGCRPGTRVFVLAERIPELYIGVLGGIATGALMGLINGLNVSILKLPPFIATLAMMLIAQGLALVLSGVRPIYFSKVTG